MEVQVTQHDGGIAELALLGRLNMVTAARVRDAIHEALVGNHSRIALDLSRVEFMDSSGLGALVWGYKAAREAGGDLRLVNPAPQVELVLQLTNMGKVLTTAPTVEDAFRS